MDDGLDFASYVAARWPALVRTLVLLGLAPDQADTVAREGLARCARGFSAAQREGDVDAWVYHEVLAARTGRHPEPDAAAVAVDPTITDLADREERLTRLVGELDRMPEPGRSAVALSHAADLDRAQVGDVLGVGPQVVTAALATGPSAPDLRYALGAVPLRPAPVEAVVERVRERRRQQLRWAAAAVAACLVVVGVATWFGTRSEDPALPEGEVRAAANPANIPWYANGVLHLAEVTVALPQVDTLVQVPDGVVYSDRQGAVVLVDQQGRQSLLGRTEPGEALASWAERGWVAWVDVEGDRELVVHDTLGRVELARREAEPGLRVVAVDQEQVYYELGGDPWAWRVPDEDPGREPGEGLVDVASAVRVWEVSDVSVMVTQPLFDIQVTVPGQDAVLSPDGDHVMVRMALDLPDEVRIYGAADGRVVRSHLRDSEVAVAAAFGPDHTVTYVIAVREHAPDGGAFVRLSETGPRLMRTCDLDANTCETVTQFSNDRGVPVLPS